jgi:hypothetical protein
MCYLVRQQQAEAAPGGSVEPPGFGSVRPRWVGAAAAMLIGGLAVAAALVTTPSQAPQVQSAREAGAPLPVATRSTPLPAAAGGVEQTALPMDDGVPGSSTEMVKAGAGGCSHGL